MSLTREDRNRRIGNVFRVATGNFLEQYDFFVYGIYAASIGQAFFPSDNDFAATAKSFGAFAISFLMRPLGAIILGAYIDRVGRRQGLLVTLALMALGTLTLGLTPGYAAIGIAAPIIIVTGRGKTTMEDHFDRCRASRPAPNWVGCRSTWPRSPRPGERASTPRGRAAASRSRWCSPPCSARC